MKTVIATTAAPGAIGPYSQAIEANGFVFVSGQIPLDPATGAFVPGGVEEQAEQSLRNLKAVLAGAGCTLGDVVKTTVFLTDMAHAAEFHGQTAHVVINYRGKVNRTFAISASAVLEYMNTQTRKSIPWQWAALNGIEVEQRLLRVHWRYDVEGLLKRLEGGEAV